MKRHGVRLPDARSQIPRVEVRGQDARWHEDLYHRLLITSWWMFFAIIALAFVVLNVAFALAYLMEPGSIAGARARSFEDSFFFSVQTLATIGYGSMSPATLYAHCVVTLEALAGMLSVALMTGLTFAKFARPTARILFSDKVVLSKLNGVPTLMFRMANWRGNLLVEAQLRVVVLLEEISSEGERFRRPTEIPLVRDRNSTFFLSWTAMHTVDEKSPFYGPNALKHLCDTHAQIILSLSGLDETAGTQIHARHSYEPSAVVVDARFADVIATNADGSRIIDYTRFHEVEPAKEKLE